MNKIIGYTMLASMWIGLLIFMICTIGLVPVLIVLICSVAVTAFVGTAGYLIQKGG